MHQGAKSSWSVRRKARALVKWGAPYFTYIFLYNIIKCPKIFLYFPPIFPLLRLFLFFTLLRRLGPFFVFHRSKTSIYGVLEEEQANMALFFATNEKVYHAKTNLGAHGTIGCLSAYLISFETCILHVLKNINV